MIEWKFELNIIREYLSKFYSSEWACMREYIANAIASHFRANVREPVLVELTPEKLVVEDFGIGISKKTFETIFLWFGRSEHRNVEGVQGKFGLGAKSFLMLTGSKGYMIMKTKSRKTEEAYTAKLTAQGAEIIDEEGLSHYGTRFEIFFERPLDEKELREWIDKTRDRFRYTRIPIKLKVKANFKIYDSEEYETTIKPELELIDSTDIYDVYIDKKGNGGVVVGDVLVSRFYSWWWGDETRLVLRFKVEDGREFDFHGLKLRAPEPLPNRDDYKNISELEKAFKTYYNYFTLVKEIYDILNSNEDDPQKWRKVEEKLELLGNRCIDYKEILMTIVQHELPDFIEKLKKALAMFVKFQEYGYGAITYKRSYEPTWRIIAEYRTGRKIFYTYRNITPKHEVILNDNCWTVYKVDNAQISKNLAKVASIFNISRKEIWEIAIDILKQSGIKELSKIKAKDYYKVYLRNTIQYYSFEDIKEQFMKTPFIIVLISRKYEIPHSEIPEDVWFVVTSSKKSQVMFKEAFGEFCMTIDEWEEWLKENTFVTDGYEIKSLAEVIDEASNLYTLTEDDKHLLPLIPILNEIIWKKKGTKMYVIINPLLNIPTFEEESLYEYLKERYLYESEYDTGTYCILRTINNIERLDLVPTKIAQALALAIFYIQDDLHEDLVNILYRELGIPTPKIRSIEDIKREIPKLNATLRVRVENTVVDVPNPLIPDFMYDDKTKRLDNIGWFAYRMVGSYLQGCLLEALHKQGKEEEFLKHVETIKDRIKRFEEYDRDAYKELLTYYPELAVNDDILDDLLFDVI